MADNSVKVSQLPTAANAATTDRVLVLRDPNGSPSVRTVALKDLSANMTIANTVPATASSNGVAGTIRYDSNYVYICISNGNWKRASLNSW